MSNVLFLILRDSNNVVHQVLQTADRLNVLTRAKKLEDALKLHRNQVTSALLRVHVATPLVRLLHHAEHDAVFQRIRIVLVS